MLTNSSPGPSGHSPREALDQQLIIVSNREPFIHIQGADGQIQVRRSAGGVVTAVEPLLRRCGGTWVAHGGGSADRASTDEHDTVAAPPGEPSYQLRRIWLSDEEVKGHYLGFCNNGLWPMCHRTAILPDFTQQQWQLYKAVNLRFASAVAEECSTDRPIIFVQDYHLALLPRYLRRLVPKAEIAFFWHIPWPDESRVRLCPWHAQIVKHLLDANLIGFNTRQHCLAFLNCIQASFDTSTSDTRRGERTCRIGAYPESIEFLPPWIDEIPAIEQCRTALRTTHNIPANVCICLGVDRWDYTKGLIEKLLAFELFLATHPHRLERISLIQILAPTRSSLPAYLSLQAKTLHEARRINARFGTSHWQPIVLIPEEQSIKSVYSLYRGADFCWVNSLDDGMNLVAKEFVSARYDEDGALLLSSYAGVAQELNSAILVDPTNYVEIAAKLEEMLCMSKNDRRSRMRLMRGIVKMHDAHSWANNIIRDLQRSRQADFDAQGGNCSYQSILE